MISGDGLVSKPSPVITFQISSSTSLGLDMITVGRFAQIKKMATIFKWIILFGQILWQSFFFKIICIHAEVQLSASSSLGGNVI